MRGTQDSSAPYSVARSALGIRLRMCLLPSSPRQPMLEAWHGMSQMECFGSEWKVDPSFPTMRAEINSGRASNRLQATLTLSTGSHSFRERHKRNSSVKAFGLYSLTEFSESVHIESGMKVAE